MARSPIHVRSTRDLQLTPAQVGEAMLDVANWKDFKGYGPLPGIREARFRLRTPGVVGSQIAVSNTDGSGHVEEITDWVDTSTGELVMRSRPHPRAVATTRQFA